MPQPTPYTPTTDFSQQEANNVSGRSTVSTAALDAEFANIDVTLDQVLVALALIQRDDGRLKDLSVEVHTLSPDVLNLMGGFNLRGLWAPSTAYAAKDIASNGAYTYVCKTPHTSGGSFDGQYWTQFGFTSGADAAQAAAAAQNSATNAANSAASAASNAALISGSVATATAAQSAASTSATNAAASASAASASATNAANSASASAASAASVGFTISSATSFQNKTLTAGDGNVVEATRGPGASQIAWRNKIINGGGQIQQRGPMPLSASANTSFCCDQITVQAAGGTGLSGNAGATTLASRSGYCFGAINCSWTSATMKIQTRINATATVSLNGKSATVSGRVYHTLGSARTCRVVVQKANSTNDFSGVTTLFTSSTFSASSDATTPFSYTFALGATDGATGLLVSVEDTTASTAVSKTFVGADFQLEEGTIATPFEVRPLGVELMLCQEYYEKSFPIGTAPAQNTGSTLGAASATGQVTNQRFGTHVQYKVTKWARPSLITLYSPNAASGNWSTNVTTPTAVVANDGEAGFYVAGTSNVTAGADYAIHWTAEAKL